MIDRICISINNKCNMSCAYCHFHEKNVLKDEPMDILEILRNVKEYANHPFKIGFVGNGEPLLSINELKEYLRFLEDAPNVQSYTITNGTVDLSDEDWMFLEEHGVNVGFSIDGNRELHNKYRCGSFDKALSTVEHYKEVTGHYPTFNATVGEDSINQMNEIIAFFKTYGTRVTFSRMIGKFGISLDAYHRFIAEAEKVLNVRRGGLDCTMYGGKCGAGTNNYFFANGKVYYCGNCVDLPAVGDSGQSFFDLEKVNLEFNRKKCYKESLSL